jgi:hypothetical protein
MQSCVSRNGVNPQGLFGLYPRKRECLGGCESADHPKITPTAEDLLRPNYLFGSGSAGLGHTKIESTVRYLGIEVDDALAIAEQVDV